LKFVERAVSKARGRALVYAGIGDTCLADSVAAANEYFRAGVDAVVAHPPVYFPLEPRELLAYFQALLDKLAGPLILYNIPSTTRVSIPLEVVAQLQGHPRLAGIKDSENDAKRLEELLTRFRGKTGFSIFIGVGSLMAKGLRLGAHGIVPSVGNLAPEVCRQLCASAVRGDWAEGERLATRMTAVAAIYQKNRTLGQSLAALKAAMHLRGLIQPHMLPPLLPVGKQELETVRAGLLELGLLN
jgi:4-hydroxy-tetrahydrodipicolinate synthase